jgi:tRNA pseudouridine32 synthase/23S rRNA pseudouridine746 synthase
VIGKMFGVLVCQNQDGEIGYLWAFSGKLAGENHHSYFVPTIFDMLQENGFFRKDEEVLIAKNRQIEILEHSDELKNKCIQLETTKNNANFDIQNQKQKIKRLKIERDEKRISFTHLSSSEIEQLELELSEESKKESILLKKMTKYWNLQLENTFKRD